MMQSLPSIIFSSLNLARFRRARRPLSLILNLIVDGFLVFEIVPLGSQALSRFYDEDFYWWHNGKARAAAKAELVILGIGLVANLVAGLVLSLNLFPWNILLFSCCLDLNK